MRAVKLAGTSVQALRIRQGRVHFAAPMHDSPQSMWWRFALDDTLGPHVDCVWEHTEEVLGGGGLGAAVPVYRQDGLWRRVPVRGCQFDAKRHELHFRVPTGGGRVEVAYCYPYGPDRVTELLQRLARTREGRVRTIGESEQGRPFQLVEVGHGPRHVWLTARHHAGEVSGAYVLEGLLRRAVRWPELLDRITIHAAPVMDVDGVAGGMYGKDRTPRDYNRDYVAQPCRPEVAALMRAAEEVGQAHVFVDLHAPAPGDRSFFIPVEEPLAGLDHWQAAWELARLVEVMAPAGCPCRVADLSRHSLRWYGDLLRQVSTNYFYHRFGGLSMTLETTYHRSWNGRLVTPGAWQGLGRALLDAIAVREGLLPAPDVSGIELPPSTIPRLAKWWCLFVPEGIEVQEQARSLSLTGAGESNAAAVMARPLRQEGPEATFAYRLEGTLKELAVVAKGFDSASGLATGTHDRVVVPLRPSRTWQTVSVPHSQAAYRLIFRVEGLQGRVDVRTYRVC